VKNIGYLAFDGMQALDLFGPLEAFQEANEQLPKGRRATYRNVVVTLDGSPVVSSSGVTINAHKSIKTCPPLHTLVISGGAGARAPDFPVEILDWIESIAPKLTRIGSVCTGLFILARTGLLDGKRVTTHWHHIHEAREKFHALKLDPEALYLRNGKFFTAAGVTASIDMALALIEEDLGRNAALKVARHLVVFFKRPGDQRQYSSVLQNQTNATDKFSELTAWITDNLSNDLSSHILAERVGLSERQFRRRFAQVFGETPTRYIERIRIEAASGSLVNEPSDIDAIARNTGFTNADTFRRSFERLRGITPSDYRRRFSGLNL